MNYFLLLIHGISLYFIMCSMHTFISKLDKLDIIHTHARAQVYIQCVTTLIRHQPESAAVLHCFDISHWQRHTSVVV